MNFQSKVTGLAALISLAAAAQTTDPRVRTELAAYPDSVTISQTATIGTPITYLTYVVTFTNGGGSDVNQLRITGATSVTGNLTSATLPQQDEAGNSLVYPGCTLPAAVGSTTFSCDFVAMNPIAPGGTFNFPVIVKVPQYSNPLGPFTGQAITLATLAEFREGRAGDTASPNSLGTFASALTAQVDALSGTSVKSAIVKGGGKVFTGNNSIPTLADLQTTSVVFDPLSFLTTSNLSFIKAEVNETAPVAGSLDAAQCANAKTFKTCFVTQLKAEDQQGNHVRYNAGNFLSQTIRSHPTNLRNGAKPEEFVWWYVSDMGVTSPINLNPKTDFCPKSLTGSPTATYTGVPCLAALPKCYTRKESLSLLGDTSLEGVCEWTFINDGNGFVKGY